MMLRKLKSAAFPAAPCSVFLSGPRLLPPAVAAITAARPLKSLGSGLSVRLRRWGRIGRGLLFPLPPPPLLSVALLMAMPAAIGAGIAAITTTPPPVPTPAAQAGRTPRPNPTTWGRRGVLWGGRL